jgi:hypothetical protein
MKFHLGVVQFKGDIAVEDEHVIDRVGRMPSILANSLYGRCPH